MLTNNQIVEHYYNFLVGLKMKFGINDDCFQMAILDVLEYNNSKLNEMHSRNELRYWLVRVFKNYWYSHSSRYYNLYEKYYEHHISLPEESED